MDRRLLVTHHAPDLDAIAAVWLFKRFDNQHYGDARIAFVDPGQTISQAELGRLGWEGSDVTHVDTGLGEFDHHQPGRGERDLSAARLVYDHVCQVHPELAQDQPLKFLVEFVTEIDHFGEIYWPEASHQRYVFMVHDLIRGLEFIQLHNDDSQLQFGMTCLDSAYSTLNQRFKAEEIIAQEGQQFEIRHGRCLGVETSNDDTIKVAQKQGYVLVVRKDQKLGTIRIKCRPDAPFDLRPLADKIKAVDTAGSWYYHPSGKMLLNGSSKQRQLQPSPLTLAKTIELIKETYG
ncbi:MAG: hypothetical protein COU69_03275 [Candidatus Pacebacteria bacterium CG10_big_fil_rev_8_21_14_0_10_56_10]|nr:MAG: hypothetical protein COU69_03275 [Candidatus Pacebacteria bacterium CG10_big_fil_rev_8_21_14_0_10_56_10]